MIYYPEMTIKNGEVYQHIIRCDFCGKRIEEKEEIYHCYNRNHKNGCDFCTKCIEKDKLNPEINDNLIKAFAAEKRTDYTEFFKDPPLVRSKVDPKWIPPKEFNNKKLKINSQIQSKEQQVEPERKEEENDNDIDMDMDMDPEANNENNNNNISSLPESHSSLFKLPQFNSKLERLYDLSNAQVNRKLFADINKTKRRCNMWYITLLFKKKTMEFSKSITNLYTNTS